MTRRRIAAHQQMQRDRAAHDLARVDHEQAIGLVGDLVPRAQLAEHLGDRLRVAHRNDVLGHEPADRALVVVTRIGQPRPVLRRQRLRHFLEHVVGGLARQVGEIVGVEREQDRHELVARELARGASRDVASVASTSAAPACSGSSCRNTSRRSSPGSESRIAAMSAGCCGFEVPLQLDEVLAMLHLLEQVVARGLLPAGERGQHAMTIEQAHDLVAQIPDRLTSGSG